MKICIVGTGYVGLCSGVGFALKGHDVTCVDVVEKKVGMINQGKPPIFEKGLEEGLRKALGEKKLKATLDLESAVKESDAIFICVGTPSREDGGINLDFVKKAAQGIGKALANSVSGGIGTGKEHIAGSDYKAVVVKSTVVPGTTESLRPELESGGKIVGKDFGLAMNPEFLREGSALQDFLEPDRIVIGNLDERSGDLVAKLYEGFGAPIVRVGIKAAEMIKYASNAMLATKISFSNEIGNICKQLGIDTYEVMEGVGLDKRIGPKFLQSGIGYGGSCFPKDVSALAEQGKGIGYDTQLLDEVMELNKRQREVFVQMLEQRLNGISGKKIAVLGLAFKSGTDDVRESPAIEVIEWILKKGGEIIAYDPKAMETAARELHDVVYAGSAQEALKGADACIVLTDWPEFKALEDKDFQVMDGKVILEGRKVLNKDKVSGFEGICW